MAITDGAAWRLLHTDDPYAGFPLEGWDLDLQGWGSKDPVFAHLIEQVRPGRIIEVGTWKGASAINMARHAARLKLSTQIICVDTWLGSHEHFLKRDHEAYRASLHMRHGYPHLYEQFMANVLHTQQQHTIVALPQTSQHAAVILRRLGLTAPLIYIDAAHDYEPALEDLDTYWRLLDDGGVLFGDDYKHQPVRRAVDTFATAQQLEIHATKTKFALTTRADFAWPPS